MKTAVTMNKGFIYHFPTYQWKYMVGNVTNVQFKAFNFVVGIGSIYILVM